MAGLAQKKKRKGSAVGAFFFPHCCFSFFMLTPPKEPVPRLHVCPLSVHALETGWPLATLVHKARVKTLRCTKVL